jgi:hypothetical protein
VLGTPHSLTGGLRPKDAFGSNPPYALRLEGEHVGALRFLRLAILVMSPALLLA